MKRVSGDAADSIDGKDLLIPRNLLKGIASPENPAYMLIRH
jgi:hypothetical protein